jgi:hypothetical protein
MGNSLNNEDNRIDTSLLDYTNLEHLYGVFRYYGYSHSESRGLAGRIYYNFTQKNEFTKDGQKRKWERRDKKYRIDMLDNAIDNYDESKFVRLLNQTSGSRRRFDEYAKITYDITQFVIDWLINDWDNDIAQEIALINYNLDFDKEQLDTVSNTPMYQDTTPSEKGVYNNNHPSPKAVRVICSKLDGRSKTTYRTTLQRLRRNGNVKLANLGGNDFVVYPAYEENPEDYEYIKTNGEKYDRL